ncbi:MAG TPA: YraN family protein [Lacunisphaera sp.]|nr:YraN family protein [Lacunisphaera sp.]
MIRWLKNLLLGTRAAPVRAVATEAGARGEQAAADFLRTKRGFAIVTRNWRNPRDLRDEIDVVCRDGDVLVFVEVKARAAGAMVNGYQAVDERKKRALRRSVQAYLGQLTPPPRTFRLDIVEVTMSERLPPQVMHYENAPLFPKGYVAARQTAVPFAGGEGKPEA